MDKKTVFVSYSFQDKQFADWIVATLTDNNINTWYDSNEIKAGDSIKQRIEEGIKTSSAIIIVFSKNSVQSKWVQYELNSALLHSSLKQGIKIIIAKIDDVEIPSDISGYQYISFSENKIDALSTLLKTLASVSDNNYSRIEWKSLSSRDFENLVSDVLIKEGLSISKTPKTKDGGIDFIGHFKNQLDYREKILIETKFYTNQKVSIGALRQLYGLSIIEKYHKAFLITNSQITNAAREFLSALSTKIILWEEQQLLNKLYQYPDIVEKYFQIKPLKEAREVKLIDNDFLLMQSLIDELNNCPDGFNGWRQYEDLGIKILKHLFVPALDEPKIQSKRESGIDIRDAIFPNRSNDKNWSFIREDYDAKYIVVEFKNYTQDGTDIDKHTVLQLSDYMKKTIGRFGIICSKKLPNKSGLEKRKDVFIEHEKLIIFISNEHLKEMIIRKYKKLDPSDVIIDLIDDFNLTF